MTAGSGHVDIYRRTDPVMYTLEDRGTFDRIIFGRTPKFNTNTAAAQWQVWCAYYDGNVITTTFANDAKYNCTWDDRASYFSGLGPGAAFPGETLTGEVESTSPIAGGRITLVTLTNAAWTAIPAVAVANRQGLGIQNLAGNSVRLNWTNTAPAGEGILLGDGSERYYSVKASATLYGRFTTLASGVVTVEELFA
jgi:hypothetical protein